MSFYVTVPIFFQCTFCFFINRHEADILSSESIGQTSVSLSEEDIRMVALLLLLSE